MIATGALIYIIAIKTVTHIFSTETVTCICAPETLIATETVTCLIATDVITSIIAIESVSCIVPAETSTFRIAYRNFHLQKWCLSEIHLITKNKWNKWVTTKFKTNSFSTPSITWWRNLRVDRVNESIVLYTSYFNFQFSYLHTFYIPVTLKPSLAQELKLIFKFSTI